MGSVFPSALLGLSASKAGVPGCHPVDRPSPPGDSCLPQEHLVAILAGMPYYLAYGSNLSSRQMTARCPGAFALGPASLDGYTLAFTRRSRRWGGHAADVLPRAGARTWGVAWQVDEHHLDALDHFEGVPTGVYARHTVTAQLPGGPKIEAVTYRVVRPVDGSPSARYLHTILEGAREFGLPSEWIAHLATFAPRQR